jgi:dolichyl-diphosphooligosaccharide---protein glycosyltransferase
MTTNSSTGYACSLVGSAIALSTLIDTYADPTEPPSEDEQTGNAGAGAAPTNGSSSVSKKDGPATLSKKAKEAATVAPAAPATPTSPGIKGVLADILLATGSISKGGSAQRKGIFGLDARLVILLNTLSMLCFFVMHCARELG